MNKHCWIVALAAVGAGAVIVLSAMNVPEGALAAAVVGVVGLVALVGILLTKIEGWGRFSTSALLILVAVIAAAVLGINDKLEGDAAQILLAVIGFAGGICAGRGADGAKGTAKPKMPPSV